MEIYLSLFLLQGEHGRLRLTPINLSPLTLFYLVYDIFLNKEATDPILTFRCNLTSLWKSVLSVTATGIMLRLMTQISWLTFRFSEALNFSPLKVTALCQYTNVRTFCQSFCLYLHQKKGTCKSSSVSKRDDTFSQD